LPQSLSSARRSSPGAYSAPLLAALEAWLREERYRLSRSASVAQPIDYMLKRWDRFARFIEDGRVCLPNNAPNEPFEELHSVASSWLFATPH
jgi:transposase